MNLDCQSYAADRREHSMVQEEGVELTQFEHQVGGMTRLFTINDVTICKPCLHRELLFYHTMPDALSPFTPSLSGMLGVRIDVNDAGDSVPVGFPIKHTLQDLFDEATKKSVGKPATREPALCLRQKMNQYKRSYQQELRHIDEVQKEVGQINMAFDNILVGLHRPSILDLKVGLRLYGDDHAMEVRDWKVAKYNGTTSISLGLRNCGMKVYNRVKDVYMTRTKYECFNYDQHQFCDSLETFLYDGVVLRLDVISQLIQKLRVLRDAIVTLIGVRFYSVSLLLVYDGSTQAPSNVEDKFHARQSKNVKLSNGDSGLISGDTISQSENDDSNTYANKFRDHLTGKLAPDSQNGSERMDSNVDHQDGATLRITKSTNAKLDNVTESKHSSNSNANIPPTSCDVDTMTPENVSKVDVRLIDFGHATHSSFPGDSIIHNGPHRGFIHGIDNLIDILTKIHAAPSSFIL